MKEFLDKCWERVYRLRKKSRNKTQWVREIRNKVEMKRGRGRGQLL